MRSVPDCLMQEYDERFLPLPRGSVNTGAICWLNSLIQSLLSCPLFIKRILESKDELSKTSTGIILYITIIRALKDAPEFVTSISDIQKEIVKSTRAFGMGQECVSEGLNHMMDQVQNTNLFLNNLFVHRFRVDIICEYCNTNKESGVDYGISIDLFHCKQIETYNDFIKNIKVHMSELDQVCTECNNPLKRKYKLTMLPEIVIIMFNKYDHRTLHYFPEEFELTSTNNKIMVYQLVAQIEHYGSRFGGHYFAKCRRQNNKVYLLNDQGCTPDNFKPNVNTYIVIYHFKKYKNLNIVGSSPAIGD